MATLKKLMGGKTKGDGRKFTVPAWGPALWFEPKYKPDGSDKWCGLMSYGETEYFLETTKDWQEWKADAPLECQHIPYWDETVHVDGRPLVDVVSDSEIPNNSNKVLGGSEKMNKSLLEKLEDAEGMAAPGPWDHTFTTTGTDLSTVTGPNLGGIVGVDAKEYQALKDQNKRLQEILEAAHKELDEALRQAGPEKAEEEAKIKKVKLYRGIFKDDENRYSLGEWVSNKCHFPDCIGWQEMEIEVSA